MNGKEYFKFGKLLPQPLHEREGAGREAELAASGDESKPLLVALVSTILDQWDVLWEHRSPSTQGCYYGIGLVLHEPVILEP